MARKKTVALGISLHGCRMIADEVFAGNKVKPLGFEERIVGPFVVNIFYYSVERNYEGVKSTEFRADTYVNGKQGTGMSFGNG